jgi:hypothetical protein
MENENNPEKKRLTHEELKKKGIQEVVPGGGIYVREGMKHVDYTGWGVVGLLLRSLSKARSIGKNRTTDESAEAIDTEGLNDDLADGIQEAKEGNIRNIGEE